MTLNIRPATREDIVRINGCVPLRAHAFVAEDETGYLATGGFVSMPIGGVMMFLDITPEVAKKYPVALVKMFRRLVKLAQDIGRPHIYSMPQDDRGDIAIRFLERLGFEKTEEGFYKWQRYQQ